MMTTWRKLLTNAGVDWDDVVGCTLSDEQLDIEFDDGFGSYEGRSFTLWTSDRVYFSQGYDGTESVRSVPRNPCAASTAHAGGQ